MKMAAPVAVVVVVSGKRKSGKDYISQLLVDKLGADKCAVLHLSGPLKKQYAKEQGLDFKKLLDASEYKEKYRADMIRWGEEKRNQDPEFFCRIATSEVFEQNVWIISDARRQCDVNYFKKYHNNITITVRVQADLDVRKQRGFIFTKGIDDAESECGLDSGVNWDIVITNNGDKQELDGDVEEICKLIDHIKL